MHERGMADDEIVEDHERERFAGASPAAEDTRTEDEQPGRFTPGTGPATGARAADQVPPSGDRPAR
jgi:hypothetical protein